MIIHVVQPGDTIYKISQIYSVPYTRIVAENEIANPNNLVVGETLVISSDKRFHTIKPGESLYSISRLYGVTVNDILASNPQIKNPAQIYPGQVLVIKADKLRTIEVNGYAYPTINRVVLNKTLPYLTYLSIFSYQVNEDGSLITIDDDALIKAAYAKNVAPIMVITNRRFSSDVVKEILNNTEAQDNLINNLVTTLNEKNYYGLNIDFEYIYEEDREAYNQFLRRIDERLSPLGYKIFTSLAPKISADQQGRLYEAHDYDVHGQYADRVIIMTYEWGYTYGPPLAVAPYKQVREVLDYAVTAIPTEKILMGIPNYGYDWTLPYIRGSAAKALSPTAAVNLARRVGARIKFDEKAKSPYFNYYDRNGKEHVVWFEDARSFESKLLLVDQYNLAGVSYWTIGNYTPQNWIVLESLYDIKKVF